MKIKPVKTAVIGAGMISPAYLDSFYHKFSIIDLVGISDIVSEKSKEKAEIFKTKQLTNEQILNDPEIELVLNLTYPSARRSRRRGSLWKKVLSARLFRLFQTAREGTL